MPPAVVEKLKPVKGPTLILVVFNADPLIVNELGPAVVFKQTLPKAVSAVALIVGVSDKVVNVCSLP